MRSQSLRTFVLAIGLAAGILVASAPRAAEAHPGGTDGNGCHTCRTNCTERYGIPYGFYHRHGPVRPCFEAAAPPPPPPRTPTATPAMSRTDSVQSTSSRTAVVQGGGPGGIALRRDCTDDARTSSAVLNDRTEVTVTAVGAGRCGGWSIVRTSDGETWIRDAYLLVVATPTATASVVAAAGQSSTPSATAPPRTAAATPTTTATAVPVASTAESKGSPLLGLVFLAAIGGGIFWLVKRPGR